MNCHEVIADNLKTGEHLEFDSLSNCGKYFNKIRQVIYEKIINGIPTRDGWIFDYKTEVEE